MRKLTIWLIKYNLKKAIEMQKTIENDIIVGAYNNMIKNYKDTIMFLEAEIMSTKTKN